MNVSIRTLHLTREYDNGYYDLLTLPVKLPVKSGVQTLTVTSVLDRPTLLWRGQTYRPGKKRRRLRKLTPETLELKLTVDLNKEAGEIVTSTGVKRTDGHAPTRWKLSAYQFDARRANLNEKETT
jgi:hypothetical protein